MSKLEGSELVSEIIDMFDGKKLCSVCGDGSVLNSELCRECWGDYERGPLVSISGAPDNEDEMEIEPRHTIENMRWLGTQVFFSI